MKKFIVLIMALITIFSASVSSYAMSGGQVFVDWEIVDYMTNIIYDGYNCSLVYHNTARPTPNMTNISGAIGTQETTYNVLHALYETVTVKGASWQGNFLLGGVFYWYEYNGYCWIKYDVENSTNTFWAGNYQGKILYCKAPASETTYTISAIAGATGYCLTNRPAGTTGNGYLGDLLVTQDNLTTIHGVVDGLGGAADYYMVLRIVNGEYRYYIMATYPNRQQYFVCNTSGQLFYALRDEVTDDGGDTGGGSTFDPTEVITAINSVYSAINSMNSNLGTRLANILNATNGIGVSVENLAANVVTGFTGVQEQLSTLNSYFTDLSGLFPVQETITLLGSDTRVAWDSADRITNVTTAGFNGDLIVKERPGDLVDESGYEKVTINETEYSLYNDNNGYRRIKADNNYPNEGNPVPQNTFFFFPFEDTLASSVGDYVLSYGGTPSYSTDAVNGKAFVFDGSNYLTSSIFSSLFYSSSPFTYSFWFFPVEFSNSMNVYSFEFYDNGGISYYVYGDGTTAYYLTTTTGTTNKSGTSLNLKEWNNISFSYDGTTVYCFLNGTLDCTFYLSSADIRFDGELLIGQNVKSGCMIDNLIFVNGTALWTSSFDPYKDAVFSAIAKDYFLACTDQEITLNFYDTEGEQVTEHRWNQYTVVNNSRLPDGYTELEYIQSSGTQYVNVGISVPSSSARVVVEFYPISINSDNPITGHFYSSWNWMTNMAFVTSSSRLYVSQADAGDISNSINTLEYTTSYYKFNSDSSVSIPVKSYTDGYNDTIFYGGGKYGSHRLYSYQLYNGSTLVRDFVPCKNPSNAVGLYDLVNGQFYGNSGTGSFVAGNEVSNGSGIGQLVGVVSSTNRNAYPDDGEQNDFYYEYIGAFTEYPSFSQTLSPTDVNGNAIIMGRLEDDFSEIYMDISTMMWYCHDPQTQTEILLSSANQEIMNDTIYVRQNYTMLPADQITADALQNLLPVDSPVYLDMPEGAKLTISYDHYTGWFRMMYILMDKQTKLLSDLDIVNETIINVENTVIDITNNNPAYNVFYITKTDGTTESVGDAAKDAAVFVGDVLSMFYRLVFDDALDNVGILKDFEGAYSNTEVSVW